MAFVPLRDCLPALARRETRSIQVGDGVPDVGPGRYLLHEHYCADPACDCRRVLLVVTAAGQDPVLAAITFAWEAAEHYVGRECSAVPEGAAGVAGAAAGDARIVRSGVFVFFATATRDAWLLDEEDGLALQLARDGERLGVRIVETEQTIAIEWTHDYAIDLDGGAFVVGDRRTGRVSSVVGYERRLLQQLC